MSPCPKRLECGKGMGDDLFLVQDGDDKRNLCYHAKGTPPYPDRRLRI
jgi:hypothetical protein